MMHLAESGGGGRREAGTGGRRVRFIFHLAFDAFDVVTTPQVMLKKEEGLKEKPEVNSRTSTSQLIN